jgi:FKBP-type peptidyl-prolyl cis-trans isomerase FklB
MDKLSYALGVNLGAQVIQANIKISDYKSFVKGVEDVSKDKESEIPFSECQQILNDYFVKLQEEETKKAVPVKKAGEEFLSANAKRVEVKTTASGLQYEILKEGKGAKPKANDKVRVHYHGTLIDGKVFDSSVLRGIPAEFNVNQVISGWVEALQIMPVGSKWKLFIPSNLAYGQHGAGNAIKPHAALVFEVELIDIV